LLADSKLSKPANEMPETIFWQVDILNLFILLTLSERHSLWIRQWKNSLNDVDHKASMALNDRNGRF